MFARLLDFCDSLMAEEYACYINVRIIEQASRMELSAYEDPHFYDRLDRARVQGAKIVSAMIQASGRLVQRSVSPMEALQQSPFFLLMLSRLSVSLGCRCSFRATILNPRASLSAKQTPARRELDYLRTWPARRAPRNSRFSD